MNFDDYQKCCDVLGLDSVKGLEYKTLRTAYLKKSLKYHPDKNNGNDEKFKEIVNAYETLHEYLLDKNSTKVKIDINTNYSNILEEMLNHVFSDCKTGWNKEFVFTTIQSILKSFLSNSYKIFDNLDSNVCMQIYDFLVDFNDIGFIDKTYLSNLREIIQKKMDNVIILQPTLIDLLNDKIYKLDLFNNTFYVPLWHNELIFSSLNNFNFIVKIEPILDDNTLIDDENNIIYSKDISFNDLETVFNLGYLNINIGNKCYKILSENIRLGKKAQIFTFQNGVLKINEKDMFNSKERSEIKIKLSII